MLRCSEIKTHMIDAKSFRENALSQGWQDQLVCTVMTRLMGCGTHWPFVRDVSGKVYISNHYRFNLLDLALDETQFDWILTNDDLLN